jgi:flavodoxin
MKENDFTNEKIVDMPVGNTKIIAKFIWKIAGGDMFLIETVKPYRDGYHETTEVGKKELDDDTRPSSQTRSLIWIRLMPCF